MRTNYIILFFFVYKFNNIYILLHQRRFPNTLSSAAVASAGEEGGGARPRAMNTRKI